MNIQEKYNELRALASNYYTVNKKIVNYSIIGLVVVIGGFFYVKYSYLPDQEKSASEKLARTYHYFQVDSMNIVVKGDKAMKVTSAVEVADKYGFTQKGMEAAYMAGAAYLKLKKFEKALEYLNKVDFEDQILAPAVLSMKASCESELGHPEDAAKLYEEAGLMAENELSAQYLKKAGIHYEITKNWDNALSCYQVIQQKYPMSPEGSDIDKYIYKMKAEMGEFNP